jgi:hypothetical protein
MATQIENAVSDAFEGDALAYLTFNLEKSGDAGKHVD